MLSGVSDENAASFFRMQVAQKRPQLFAICHGRPIPKDFDLCRYRCEITKLRIMLPQPSIVIITSTLLFFTLDAGLLARSQYSEGPATGHLDTGFSWFPCA